MADLDLPTIPLDFHGLTPEDFERAREQADRLCFCNATALASYECGLFEGICLPCAHRVVLNDLGKLKLILNCGH